MPFRTLSAQIAVPAGLFTLFSVAGLSVLFVRSEREQVLAEVVQGSESLAETLRLSFDHAMRVNRRDWVREMIASVSGHAGIEWIRIFNKDGRISFSSRPEEVGQLVDTDADACVTCHGGPTPAATLDTDDRSRIYDEGNGHSILATIRVIPNEEGCQGASCHVSPADQSVLGVLDVAMSLEPAQQRLARATGNAVVTSLVAVVLITGLLFLLVWRRVRDPIDQMVTATRRVAQGAPSLPVPSGTTREIEILASSLNEMIESLSSSRERLGEWARTLEETVAQKVTELRDARFQVVQAEKLSSVGLVAAGIAHELNSPLMAILTFAHMVRNELPTDSQAQEDLKMIERETNRCAAIIRQLLDYSRKQVHEPAAEPCQIHVAVGDALELLKVELQNAGVEVDVSVAEELPAVEANPVPLMQIFVNLILNAIHAMPDGGRLEIRSHVAPRSEFRRAVLPPHLGAELLVTTVRDTGTGIDPDALSKVFDPFFTTKPVGQGSGLGLSVSLGIVRGYRGSILVESDGSNGTTFTVLLPVPEPPSNTMEP